MATAKTIQLPKTVFDVKVENHELLKLAYDSYLAEKRLASATTKKRGDVRGGGKKPWRQKGTGRARVGSIRSPIWRGGGIIFGPLGNENYTKRISTTSKRVALKQALSLANKAKKVQILEVKSTGKTKDLAQFVEKANIVPRNILIVVNEKSPELSRAAKNIPYISVVTATYLSVYTVLNADTILIEPSAIASLEAWLIKEDK